jgi:hypothetical protein
MARNSSGSYGKAEENEESLLLDHEAFEMA